MPWSPVRFAPLAALLVTAGCAGGGGGGSAQAERMFAAGDKALAAGNTVQAIIAFKHARELAPTEYRYHQAGWRAGARLLAERGDRVTVENQEEMRFEVGQLLEAEPQHPVYLTAMAHILEHDGKRAEAGRLLEQAVKADPKSALAQLARGDFLSRTGGSVDEAVAAYQAALAADDKLIDAHVGLGRMYLVKRDSAKEVGEMEKAATLGPDHYAANEGLGDAYLHVGKLVEAYRAYSKAAAIDPKNPEPHWGLAIIKTQAGKWAEAEAEVRLAMRGPKVPGMELVLGQALAHQPGRCGEAVGILQAYLAEQPDHPSALLELASCQATLERRDEAEATLRRLIALPLPPEGDARRDEAMKRQAAAQARLAALAPAAAAKPRK